MEVTAPMVAKVPLGSEDVRRCIQCNGMSFHVAVTRLVFTPGGARSLVLWSCELHPLPEQGLAAR